MPTSLDPRSWAMKSNTNARFSNIGPQRAQSPESCWPRYPRDVVVVHLERHGRGCVWPLIHGLVYLVVAVVATTPFTQRAATALLNGAHTARHGRHCAGNATGPAGNYMIAGKSLSEEVQPRRPLIAAAQAGLVLWKIPYEDLTNRTVARHHPLCKVTTAATWRRPEPWRATAHCAK